VQTTAKLISMARRTADRAPFLLRLPSR